MNNSYLTQWIKNAETVREEVRSFFPHLDEKQLNWRPHEEQWSIGQLFDHLVVTNTHYITRFQYVASGEHRNPFGARFKYLSDFFGKSLLKSVHPESMRKLKTVRIFHPRSGHHSGEILEQFNEQQERLIDVVRAMDFIDHETVYMASPTNKMIVYSVNDAVKIVLAHEQRHVLQAKCLHSQYAEALAPDIR